MNPVRKFASCLGWVVLALSFLPPLRASDLKARLQDDLKAYIPEGMQRWKLPGLAIAIVQDDKLLWAEGFGVREAGKAEPVTPDSIFAIGSTTKAFTAAAIGILVDRQKLRWDDPVAKHWPEFRLADPWVTKEIRVSDLLANRSGLSGVSEMLWYGTDWNRHQIIARVAQVPITEGFRYQFQYRNVMFLAAGQLIPQVVKATWDDVIARDIFEPLQMRRSQPTEAGIDEMANVARPHVIDYSGQPVPVPYHEMDNIAPAGSIVSSANDMAQWLRMLSNNGSFEGKKILQPATLAFIQRSQTPVTASGPPGHSMLPPVELMSYCLGWMTESYRGSRIVWHNGGIDGMASWVGLVPEHKTGVVVLSNLDNCDFRRAVFYRIVDHLKGGKLGDLAPELAEVYADLLQTRDKAQQKWLALDKEPGKPALPLKAYAGTYRNAAFGDVTIALEKDGLVYRRSPSHVLDLRCAGGNQFLGRFRNPTEDLRSGKEEVAFTVAKGKVQQLANEELVASKVAAGK